MLTLRTAINGRDASKKAQSAKRKQARDFKKKMGTISFISKR